MEGTVNELAVLVAIRIHSGGFTKKTTKEKHNE